MGLGPPSGSSSQTCLSLLISKEHRGTQGDAWSTGFARTVDASVVGLVGPDVQDEVPHGPMPLGHLPVIYRNVGHLEVGVGPPREVALVHLADAAGVP